MSENQKNNIEQLLDDSWNIMLGEPRKALDLSSKALERSLDTDDERYTADAFLNIGWSHLFLSNFEESMAALEKARKLFITLEDIEGVATVLNALGVLKHRSSQYSDSLDYYAQSLEVSEKKGFVKREVSSLNNIGELCLDLERYTEALEYLSSAKSKAEEIKDYEGLGVVLVNLALGYYQLGAYKNAASFIDEALEMQEEAADKINLAKAKTILGLIKQAQGDNAAAQSLHNESIEIAEAIGFLDGIVEGMHHLAKVLFAKEEYQSSLVMLQDALLLSEEKKLVFQNKRLSRTIADIYEALGEYEKALFYYKQFHELERTAVSEEIDRAFRSISVDKKIEESKAETEKYKKQTKELTQRSEELTESYNRILIISEIVKDITASINMEEVMQRIYNNVNKLISADVFGIALYHKQEDLISYEFFIENGERIQPFTRRGSSKDSFAAWAIRNEKEIFLNNVEKNYKQYVAKRMEKGRDAESLIYIPLEYQDTTIGVLTVQSFIEDAYTDNHLYLLRALASYFAIALENSRTHSEVHELNQIVLQEKAELEKAYKQIAHMAKHDNLTGLPNRRLLKEILENAVFLADRHKSKLAVMFLDLDNFKPVNDTFGHEAGDEVLREAALRMHSVIRKSDLLARVGGDEFVVVTQGIEDRQSVELVANKLKESLSQPFKVNQQKFQLGVSIGVCMYPDSDCTIEGLLQKADESMYSVKLSQTDKIGFYS
ncbi:MAG: diguanylate cyclase domain-containing protein [Spirochaetia bacterium]